MRVEDMIQELTNLLEQKQEIKINAERLQELLQQVDDLEDLIDWHETQGGMIQEHGQLLKICENSFVAIRGCVEDLHNLELATETGESMSNIGRHAKHALWNLACSLKGLQQAYSVPYLLHRSGRSILNSYLEKTMWLGALLLEIHGHGDWADFWRETAEGGHINTVNFQPAGSPHETTVEDRSLDAIPNPLPGSSGTGVPSGIVTNTRYASTPMIVYASQGGTPAGTQSVKGGSQSEGEV
jgi:hypothetical protein